MAAGIATSIHLEGEVSRRLNTGTWTPTTRAAAATLAVSLAATAAAVIPVPASIMAAQFGLEPPADFTKIIAEWTQLTQPPARTALGRQLRALRGQIVRSGEKLLSLDEVNQLLSASRRRTGV